MDVRQFLDNLEQHRRVFAGLDALAPAVSAAVDAITSALANQRKLMLCGNGGSAADCQHIAAELTGRFIKDRRPLAAVALTTDTSALTAIGNDYGYDHVFARQVQALGQGGDCLLAISTSGNSPSILSAVNAARTLGIQTIALAGRDGGKLAALCDTAIVVNSDITARIQEAHIFIGHMICAGIEAALGLGQD